MLFYRSQSGGADLSLGAARAISAASLLAYPAGAVILAAGDGPASSIAGFTLILASLICVAVMMGSSIQRIVGEVPERLDEYELQLRAKAVSAAYTCLSALVLIAIIYAAVASDRGGWVPDSYDAFNGLFWGFFLYASMLPTVFLVWRKDARDDVSPANG